MSILSSLQTIGNAIFPTRPYWTATLTTGRTISELGMIFDISRGGMRPIDWTLDLISTGDIHKLKQLRLTFPNTLCDIKRIQKDNPSITIDPWNEKFIEFTTKEKDCVFQMKIKTIERFMGNSDTFECQMIGIVTNKEEGDCTAYIWDRKLGLVEFQTNIYNFGTWREEIAAISNISHSIVGLDLK